MPKFKVKEKQLVWQVWEYNVEAETEEEALHKVMEGADTGLESDTSYTENDYSDDFNYEVERQN